MPRSGFFYLAKYDAHGTKLWSKSYKPQDINCSCSAATATPDGGYLMAGSAAVAPDVVNVYVVKTDALGNMEWDRIISNPSGLGDTPAIARSVTVAPGGYALTGFVDDPAGMSSTFLLRLNKSGKIISSEHYNFLLPGSTKTDIDGTSIQYLNDGFIIAGAAYGYGLTTPKAAFLLRVLTSGKTKWFKTYGQTAGSAAASVCETPDGGFIFTGTTDLANNQFHAYVLRTDSSGNELWSKTITQDDSALYAVSAGNKIIGTSDGGYVLAGMAVPEDAAHTLVVRIGPHIVGKK
jgi:hypothetical protein